MTNVADREFRTIKSITGFKLRVGTIRGEFAVFDRDSRRSESHFFFHLAGKVVLTQVLVASAY